MSAASWSCLTLALTLTGCALLSKAEPLDVSYFEPAEPAHDRAPRADQPAVAELRLDRVTSAEHLESRIAYREGGVEIGFYDELRWAERPEVYLRRALARALFRDRPLTQAMSGAHPALEVELLSFEEIRDPDQHRARVSVHLLLRDGARVIATDTVTTERPITASGGTGLARALGGALDEAASRAAEHTLSALEADESGAEARAP